MSSNAPFMVPVLPESAPFTAEQRAYLNGFLAGLFSHAPATGQPAMSPQPMKALAPLAILFGSQTGNAEALAKRIAKKAGQHGFAPMVHDLGKVSVAQIVSEQNVLVVTSTYGDGEPPDNAKAFWETLRSEAAPQLDGVRFSVCALGDSNYPRFCEFGKELDRRLEQLGATRVQPRQDCDVEFDGAFAGWLSEALQALADAPQGNGSRSETNGTNKEEHEPTIIPMPPQSRVDTRSVQTATSDIAEAAPKYSRANPFRVRLLMNRTLNAPNSAKDVRHVELSLEGSGVVYETGDALGVLPSNDAALVDELLVVLRSDGTELVCGKSGGSVPLREALTSHFDVTKVQLSLVAAVAERSGNAELKQLITPGANGAITAFLRGREVIDLLQLGGEFTGAELVPLLRKLQPRLYSISSSPKVHTGQVHLTVGVVRYESHGRLRKGVCSTFLAERAEAADGVPVFVHSNKAFRPPSPDVPLIMVGPGTGIAPFRAFLHERRAMGATGRNWLFFGDQRRATDFLYAEEVEAFHRDGLLTRLDLAWSRDQADKVYVQHRMLEHAAELFAWLEKGAGFYVCGDASRMAKDVDAALHEIVQRGGGFTAEKAGEYVKAMKQAGRYRRDVY